MECQEVSYFLLKRKKACAAGMGHPGIVNLLGLGWAELCPENFHIVGARETDIHERELMKDMGVDMWRFKKLNYYYLLECEKLNKVIKERRQEVEIFQMFFHRIHMMYIMNTIQDPL